MTRQLKRRIGDLESRSLERVEKLTPEQLETLSEALFDFATAADLDQWLHTQGS